MTTLAGGASPAITVRAPAKVNLALSVGPLRADGFHELATVYQAVSLYDEVVASPSRTLDVLVEGEQAAAVPLGPDNLAHRAVTMLARHVGMGAGVRLVIRKGIPVAGGMAGGSADAAAALVACDALWGLGLERDTLLTLAGRLGSDVPFCLVGGTAMGTGRGEALTPVLGRGGFHWVFALAEDGLSTPAVFAERDRLTTDHAVPAPVVAPALMQALRSGDAEALGAALTNDLQEAACSLRPALRETLAVGLDHGALGAVVSGSGPTVAFLVAGVEAGLEVAVALSASQASHGVRRAQGPVPGARVVPTGSFQ